MQFQLAHGEHISNTSSTTTSLPPAWFNKWGYLSFLMLSVVSVPLKTMRWDWFYRYIYNGYSTRETYRNDLGLMTRPLPDLLVMQSMHQSHTQHITLLSFRCHSKFNFEFNSQMSTTEYTNLSNCVIISLHLSNTALSILRVSSPCFLSPVAAVAASILHFMPKAASGRK